LISSLSNLGPAAKRRQRGGKKVSEFLREESPEQQRDAYDVLEKHGPPKQGRKKPLRSKGEGLRGDRTYQGPKKEKKEFPRALRGTPEPLPM